jgi:N-acetyl-alpha-D-muramate 1-phosphate uridylyltransferase
VVKYRETSRYFLFSEDNMLCGWRNKSTGEEILTRPDTGFQRPFAFSGIQVMSPEIFRFMTEEGKFSLTSLYLRLSEKHRIQAYFDGKSNWFDAGKSIPEK